MTHAADVDAAPAVSLGLHAITLAAPTPDSRMPPGDDDAVLDAVRREGFASVQQFREWPTPQLAAAHALDLVGSARITEPGAVDAVVGRWHDDGCRAGVVHLGDAIDDDARADAYCAAVVAAQHTHGISVMVETHRATLTQDLWRTVQLAARHPELRFNLDFSQWYVAGELTYGDYAARLQFADPVFDRTDMIHARVADPGCLQTPIVAHDTRDFVEHFRSVWTTVIERHRRRGGASPFVAIVELVPAVAYYARTHPDDPTREVADRWEQALLTRDLVLECADSTVSAHQSTTTQGATP